MILIECDCGTCIKRRWMNTERCQGCVYSEGQWKNGHLSDKERGARRAQGVFISIPIAFDGRVWFSRDFAIVLLRVQTLFSGPNLFNGHDSLAHSSNWVHTHFPAKQHVFHIFRLCLLLSILAINQTASSEHAARIPHCDGISSTK